VAFERGGGGAKIGRYGGAGKPAPRIVCAAVRALLVVNPEATTTTPAGRDVLAHALASELKLEVLQTQYRGHAAESAQRAAAAGVELIVALGGDGTVNEVVNGMLAEGPGAAPAMAVVPGGSANVFARALGISPDPLEATAGLLAALGEERSRWIGLGQADNHWFTFNAGLGWDADVVVAVDRARKGRGEATASRYLRTAITHYLHQRRHPPRLSVTLPGEPPEPELALVMVTNTDPWTYLGRRPLRTNPGASFDAGLSLLALRNLRLRTVLPTVARAFRGKGAHSGVNVLRRDDLPVVEVRSQNPVGLQLDGDYLGERTEVQFRAVPSALRVVV
jgi:diacylglycerol kinase family enzyme